jgi:aryl-alcohol dehydrogenase-like predicted oxidoreductase
MSPQNNYATDTLFQRHFPSKFKESPPLLALGTLQWGTTPLDESIINGSRGVLSESEASNIYSAFRSKGVVLFDTAEGYGGGTSEKRLGRLRQKEPASDEKNAAILMSKFLPSPWRYTHDHFESALRASNGRLGITKAPIYFLHSPMHLFRSVEFWVEAAASCKRKGLLDALGLSNCSADEVRRAVAAGEKFGIPVIVNQVHFSLLDYNSSALQEMQVCCDELGVSIIAYNCLGQGLLTDNMDEVKFSKNKPAKMMRIQWSELNALRKALRQIADKHNASMAQVAVNWCRSHNVIPLVGCRSKQQAYDTLGALDWDLFSHERELLDNLALTRCTLDSPVWRRKLFVVLAGVVMTTCRLFDLLGLGVVKKASIGM